MATTLSLASIQSAAEEKFGSLFLELGDGITVELQPALRLSKAKRKELSKITAGTEDSVPEEDRVDAVDVYHRWVRAVAKDDTEAELLIERVGERVDVWTSLQTEWSEKTQPGEASPSES